MKILKLKYFTLVLVIATLWSCAVNNEEIKNDATTVSKKNIGGEVNDSDLKETIIDGVVVNSNFNKSTIIDNAFYVHFDYANNKLVILTTELEFNKQLKLNPEFKQHNEVSQKNIEKVRKSETETSKNILNSRIAVVEPFTELTHRDEGFFTSKSSGTISYIMPGISVGYTNTALQMVQVISGTSYADGIYFQNIRPDALLHDTTTATERTVFRNSNNSKTISLQFRSGTNYSGTSRTVTLLKNTQIELTSAKTHFSGVAAKSIFIYLTN